MKLTGILLMASLTFSFASTKAQITLKMENAEVEHILKSVTKQTGMRFIYDVNSIKNLKTTVNLKNASLNTSLKEIMRNMNLTYNIHGGTVVIKSVPTIRPVETNTAQQLVVKGTVIDAVTNTPIPGATVSEIGKNNQTQTDQKGNFNIEVSSEKARLSVRMIGYQTIEQSYSPSELTIKLETVAADMDEVVVVGFGTQKKASVVGAISSVSPKDLKIPTSNLSNAFAGRLAGVVAVQRSGEPGADGANFWIRGIGTFTGGTSPLIFVDGVESSIDDMNNLAPEVIENFSVLKDATATALYGARGANGVMLITTRRGGDMERAKINFRIDNTFTTPTKMFELADAVTYMETYNQAVLGRNPNATPRFSQEKLDGTKAGLDPYLYPNVNWKDVLFKDYAMNQYANLNVTGGGKRADYFVSATFNNDNGMLKKDNLNIFDNNVRQKEYNLIANVGVNLSKSTNAVIRLNTQLRDYNGSAETTATIYQRMFESPVSLFMPSLPGQPGDTFIRFGNAVGGPISSAGSAIYFNPYASMVSGYRSTFATTNTGSVEVNQKLDFLTENLKVKGLISFKNWSNTSIRRYFTPFYYQLSAAPEGSENPYTYKNLTQGTTSLAIEAGSGGDRLLNLNFIVDWNRSFGKHDLTAMLTYLQRNYEINNPNGSTALDIYFSSLPYRNQGLASRITYAYDSKYLLEGNFGYNGSENFADGNRFGFFPSFGAGYVISNEAFWAPIKNTINNFKIRGSWGLVGNDQIVGSRFPYLDFVVMGNLPFTFGETWGLSGSGANITKLGAPGAKWELGTKYNAGFDLVMFNNKVSLTADYFTEDRKDIFMQRRVIAAETGIVGTNPFANIGRVKNSGFDATLSYNNQITKDFYLNLRGTFTYAKNELLERDEPKLKYAYQSELNRPLNIQFGYIAEGLYKDADDIANSPKSTIGQNLMPGDIKYKDLNNDGVINTDDRTYFGAPSVPQIVYGFGFSSQYKKIDFSAFFQGVTKTGVQMGGIHPFNGNATNLMQFIADDYWSESNPDAAYPRLISGISEHNNYYTSNFWNRDGSFLRLKNVELGYTYKFLRVYASGQNLLTFSKFKNWDPELGSGNGLKYPNLRIGSIGAQLNF